MRLSRRNGVLLVLSALVLGLFLRFRSADGRGERMRGEAASGPRPAAVAMDPSPARPSPPEREAVATEDLAPAPLGGEAITGVVTQRSGVPIQGAACRLLPGRLASGFGTPPADETARTTEHSGADGSFRLPAGAGVWRVIVEQPGFARWERDHLTAGDVLAVRLDPVVELRVSVLGPRGEPVPDAEIVVRPADALGSEQIRCRMRTDPAGWAFSAELAPGDWQLVVRHPAYAIAAVALAIPIGRFRVETDVQLARGVRVIGTVRDPTGAPLPDTSVRIESPYRPGFVVEEARTDAMGRYASSAVFGLHETLEVLARAEAHAEARVLVGIGAEHVSAGEAVVDIVLEPGGRSITGRAVDAHGTGVADASVRIAALDPVGTSADDVLVALQEAPSEPWLWQEAARSAGNGRFEVVGLSGASEYALLLVREPFAPRMAWAPSTEAGTLDLGELELVHRGSLFGRATYDDGTPAAGEMVVLHRRMQVRLGAAERGRWRPDGWFQPLEARATEDGTFRFDALLPGAFELGGEQVEVAPGSEVGPIELRIAGERSGERVELRGTVEDRGGRPLGLVFVRAFALDAGAPRLVGSGRTDERGAFALRVPPEGTVRLAFTDLEGAHDDHEELVQSPSTAGPVRIVLEPRREPPQPLEGLVVDTRGRPVEGCEVRLHPPEDALCACVSFRTHTDAAGAFRFERATSGPHRLVASDLRHGSRSVYPARGRAGADRAGRAVI